MAGLTEHWSTGQANAELGMPAHNPLRRLIAKLLWPVLRYQVVVNRALLAEMDALSKRLDAAELELARARGDIEHHTGVLVRHEEPLDRHEFLLQHLEPAIMDLLRQIDLVQEKVDLGARQALARYHEGIGPIRSALNELDARVHDLASTVAEDAGPRVESMVTSAVHAAMEEAEQARRGAWREALDDVWLRLNQLDLFLTEARRAFPKPPAPERLAELPSGFESLYQVFEEAFRGPEAVVRERARAYVDDLRASAGLGPVLDLGAGRGELLEVLAEAGIAAYGVDIEHGYVERCRAKGLDVREEDVRSHLAGLEERSLGAVTAIQLVEHLQTDELIELVELAARALRPGGLLILETQNPENVVVGASSFYLDPTHRRPLPPPLLAFLVGARGFDAVEVRRLERTEQAPSLARPKPDEPWAETVGSLVDAVNYHLFGPADYAIVARRP